MVALFSRSEDALTLSCLNESNSKYSDLGVPRHIAAQ